MDHGYEINEDVEAAKRLEAIDAWLAAATPKELRFLELKLKIAKENMVRSLKADLGELVSKKVANEDRSATGRKRRVDANQPKTKRVHLINAGTANQTAEE